VKRLVSLIAAAALLQGCVGAPREPDVRSSADFAPVLPIATFGDVVPGTIYNPAASFDLFMDLRARQVGDILTVLLVERTNASKESSTSTEKGSSVDTGMPILGGKPITYKGNPILNNELDSSSSFDGKADSSQSNRLDGSITVTVAGRLPNGNLLVRGEKQITINQGQEFVQLQGIVRPVDIGPENTVPSTKIGDAQITYSGKGHLADTNRPGWLARFFNSPWFPF
jgi:flagellar L-ring protein precursor FlgH